MEKKSLIRRLIDAGYPKEDIGHYATDLYVRDTPLVRDVLGSWVADNGWDPGVLSTPLLCDVFTDNVTGERMLDIAFQYNEEDMS